MAAPTLQSLTTALVTLGLPAPHPSFINPILSASATNRPLAVLTQTAKHRLLCSDLTSPSVLSPTTTSFPPNVSNAAIPSRVLPADIPVQVLEVEDLSKSKWEQIEALEMERKGEMTKGREVIRVINNEDGNVLGSTASTQAQPSTAAGANAVTKSYGPFKLLLQDYKGTKCYGFELKRVEKINYPPEMAIGCKIVLKKGALVARGMVLLEPGSCVVLGGKIEGLDKGWREGREKALREQVEQRGGEREGGEFD